jgi:hypothetical protein
MANKKKIIQGGVDVQTAAGVSALTVNETTGAVTTGIADYTGTHTVNGTQRIVSSQTVEITIQTAVADDEVISLPALLGVVTPVGFVDIVDISVGFGLRFYVRGGYNNVTIVSDPIAVGAVADTDGKFCVYYSSGYKIKNRTGAATTILVKYIGGKS